MKKPLLLQRYQYSIPESSLVWPAGPGKNSHVCLRRRPLLTADVDFENGWLKLQVDGQYLGAVWANHLRKRVLIKADLYPAAPINLNEEHSDGWTLHLDGWVDDGTFAGPCCGLLEVEPSPAPSQLGSPPWSITFYFYDLRVENGTFEFRLPVYTPPLPGVFHHKTLSYNN